MSAGARAGEVPDGHVRAWRHRMLVRSGFADGSARRLAAAPEVDLHALLDLVDLGCPPSLAVRIRGPLDEGRRP